MITTLGERYCGSMRINGIGFTGPGGKWPSFIIRVFGLSSGRMPMLQQISCRLLVTEEILYCVMFYGLDKPELVQGWKSEFIRVQNFTLKFRRSNRRRKALGR